MLRIALNDAVKQGLIPTNPASRLRAPKAPEKRVVAFTVEQMDGLLEAARETRFGNPFEFAFPTGMRRGEILALRSSDIDLTNGTCRVKRSRVRAASGGEVYETTPKTEVGMRTVALPQAAQDVLRRQKQAQEQDRRAYATAYHDYGYVFTTKLGGPILPDEVSRAFRRIRHKAGVPDLPFHATRHTSASLQLAAGIPLEQVSKRIGHRSWTTPVNTYGHMVPEAELESARKLDSFLRKTATKKAARKAAAAKSLHPVGASG